MKFAIKKADEMEMAINLKAARSAFAFLEAAIAIYCLVQAIAFGAFDTVMFIFMAAAGIIFWGVKHFETKKLTKPETEDEE